MSVSPLQKKDRARGVGRVSGTAIAVLLMLLVAPIVALSRMTPWVDWRILVGGPVAVSVFTYFSYRSDKRHAEAGDWRIPESTLHLMELLGGWPGAFLSQRIFRHKTSKLSYQVAFWIIVLLHQLLALDYLIGWRLSHGLIHYIKSKL